MFTTLFDGSKNLDILLVGEYEEDKKEIYLAVLSDYELDVFAKKPSHKKSEFLLGRWIAKHVLCEYFKRCTGFVYPLNYFEVRSVSGGAPVVVVAKEVSGGFEGLLPHVSISHAKGNIAAVRVVSADDCQGVGVDIESVRPWNETLVRRFLTGSEYQYVEKKASSEREKLATVLWSLKESYLKATGVGLRQDPQTVEMLRFVDGGNFETKYKNVTGGWVDFGAGFVVSGVQFTKE